MTGILSMRVSGLNHRFLLMPGCLVIFLLAVSDIGATSARAQGVAVRNEVGNVLVNATDIKDSWAIRHIHRLLARDMGPDVMPEPLFRPEDGLTRGQLAVMIARVLESDLRNRSGYTEEYHAIRYYRENAPSVFNDFQFRDWFGYVERAVDRGVMAPVQNQFNPREIVSRGEFIKILLKLLAEVNNPAFRMENEANLARRLNSHMTRFMDVSARPEQYPGWIKVAQNQKLLPEKGKDFNLSGWSSDWGIDYSHEFYNRISRNYEFGQNRPVSKAFAAAVFANLFCKWDVYSRQIPFDRRVGNSTRDLEARALSETTIVGARVDRISPYDGVIWIKGEKRVQTSVGSSIFRTSYEKSEIPVKVDSGAAVWFHAGEWYLVEGPDQAQRVAALMARLEGPHIEGWRINVIYRPEQYRHDRHQKTIVAASDNSYAEAPVAGYIEIIASIYDYNGRITAIRDNQIELMDPHRGRIVVSTDSDTVIERTIVTEPGLPEGSVPADSMLNPSNRDIYRMPLLALRPGEKILVKTADDTDYAMRISSTLLRLGAISNVELSRRQIRPRSAMNEHYVCDLVEWRPHTASGLLTWLFSGDGWGESYWRQGNLSALLSSGARSRDVEVYVQPAQARRMSDNDLPEGHDKLFFIAAVQK